MCVGHLWKDWTGKFCTINVREKAKSWIFTSEKFSFISINQSFIHIKESTHHRLLELLKDFG